MKRDRINWHETGRDIYVSINKSTTTEGKTVGYKGLWFILKYFAGSCLSSVVWHGAQTDSCLPRFTKWCNPSYGVWQLAAAVTTHTEVEVAKGQVSYTFARLSLQLYTETRAWFIRESRFRDWRYPPRLASWLMFAVSWWKLQPFWIFAEETANRWWFGKQGKLAAAPFFNERTLIIGQKKGTIYLKGYTIEEVNNESRVVSIILKRKHEVVLFCLLAKSSSLLTCKLALTSNLMFTV